MVALVITYYYPRRSRDILQGGEYDQVGVPGKWDRLDGVKLTPGPPIRPGIGNQVAYILVTYEQQCDIPLKRWAVVGTR